MLDDEDEADFDCLVFCFVSCAHNRCKEMSNGHEGGGMGRVKARTAI